MKGHIRERGKNWVVVVDLGKDSTGKRRQHWETVKGPKRDAQRRLREILASVETGAYVKPSHLTLGEWLQEWLSGYVATNCAPHSGQLCGARQAAHSAGPRANTLATT